MTEAVETAALAITNAREQARSGEPGEVPVPGRQ